MHYLYYVGLDVSKETFDASLVAFEDANEMAHRKFANSRKGICSCLHWVEKRHGSARVCTGLRSGMVFGSTM